MRPRVVRVLTRPAFIAVEFNATKWDSAADKAKFANALCRFIEAGFPYTLFTQRLYTRLSLCFGFITHYDRNGYFGTYFGTLRDKVRFLEGILNWPCFGDPTFTYCDAERAIQHRLRAADMLTTYRAKRDRAIERAERQLLARLREKYDGVAIPNSLEEFPARTCDASSEHNATSPRPENMPAQAPTAPGGRPASSKAGRNK